uniref:ribosomal protein S19 n=1 Tax=Euglena deses TaxID=66845 RepID=UPI0023AA7930|nr:ribosomal protein S19 [Euglena deses]WCH63368.1 ribosomal protein S19 [Euglena deses]
MSRSSKKGPFIINSLLKKIQLLNSNNSRKVVILTWSRSSTILPLMIGHTIAVYNGKEHIPILISDQMIGHLCEFVQTRTFKGHVKTDKKVKR